MNIPVLKPITFEEEIEASLELVRSVLGKLEKVEADLLKLREEIQHD